ncbi:hypothetical protein QVD17_02603 [Tagetes erecta]|uniref:non-specific serine/threonine protein kinase n=1 Tax=Tagetes erecta TaxID=13708 RepID=A0AAD8P901_TARER|nr:hypothetical protein QVD17_02603 [Tagetes erecta]
MIMSVATRDCISFDFQEMVIATQNFSKSLEIGRGSFGSVYKGKITRGTTSDFVAIKRLHPESIRGSHEFFTEVETLSKLRHSNIVSLIGYCNHDKEKILVYEFMPNGTLDDHLHKHSTTLTWVQRLKICTDAARGLDYLHHGTGIQHPIIHGDIRSANILLNESWEAKISDFGLSKISSRNKASTYVNTCVIDNFGYCDPVYFETGKLRKKSDVYSFGVVLFEIFTGKPVLGEPLYGEGGNLVSWAKMSIKAGKSRNIVDSHISNEIHSKSLKEFISIAYRCLHEELGSRPTMAEVVARLEYLRTEKLGGSLELQPASYKTKIFYRMVHMLLFFCNRGKFGVTKLSSNSNNKIVSGTICSFPSPSLKEFVLDDLKRATQVFSSSLLVGQGGFGKVYRGWVHQDTLAPSEHGDGIAIVVKRFDHISTHEYDEWQAEVNMLGHVAHPNIIRLLGYCKDGPERFLVYEYMPNKSLNYFLFTDGFEVPLSWGTRLMIMIGVARGLTYLHSRNIIFRDMKSSNILLDEAFNAKLAGFGLARYGPETGETHVCTLVKGTFGYIDPHYFQTGRLTMKSDVYSFGVVLLEVLTGRKSIYDQQYEEGQSLVQWATKIKRRNFKKIVDMRLVDNYPLKAASKCFVLALRCVKENPDDRPSSEEVLRRLEQLNVSH